MAKSAMEIVLDFRHARENRKDWIVAATEDHEFILGKQWKDEDVKVLEDAGVLVLTINKIKPIMLLLSGLQSQSKTDFKAFPKGGEDQIKSDIVTALLKHAMDTADGNYKIGEQFRDGAGLGEGWLEPYIDYTEDMLSGSFGLKKGNPFSLYIDPNSVEYDLSDAEYIIKYTPDLSKNKLYQLFPDKKAKIDALKDGRLDFNQIKESVQGTATVYEITENNDYDSAKSKYSGVPGAFIAQPLFDLTEYYYKNYITKYYVVDKERGTIKQAKDKNDAKDFIARTIQAERDKMLKQKVEEFLGLDLDTIENTVDNAQLDALKAEFMPAVNAVPVETGLEIMDRVEPEIRVTRMVGMKDIIDDDICWSFPKWKGYPFNRFAAYITTIPVKNRELMIQGVVRGLKSLQKEVNISRVSELRHLREVANSGWLAEEDSWVDVSKVEHYGSTPGINLEYRTKLKNIPQRIQPQSMTGYTTISATATQDMKDESGINTDLLAQAEGGQASGRAIALRQRQGLIMVQLIFSNLSRSFRLLGRFILSQLDELFTVEKAVRIMGDKFIAENFTEPVMGPQLDPATNQPVLDPAGQPVMVPQMDPVTKGVALAVNENTVKEVFTEVLKDSGLGKYDVHIGEGINTETTLLAEYAVLLELLEKNIPIPPDVLIDSSQLPASAKEKILKAITAAQAQPAASEEK